MEVTEIAPDLYRISVFVPEINLQFNHFLVRDDEPLLFHTGLRRGGQPVIERAALVRFEVAEAHPAQPRRVDDARHLSQHPREEPPHPGVVEERLVVVDEELVELQVDLRDVSRDAVSVRRDLV